MGKAYSLLMRPVRIFNVANRAEKVISQNKPIPAPHHASMEKQKRLSEQVNPNFMDDHYKKNMLLDQRLKDVFVTSMDSKEATQVTEEKLLPQSRDYVNSNEIDFYEPIIIPVGKCSLKQACTFMSQHKHDPVMYSSETIAAEYKMDKTVVDDILKHFKHYVAITPQHREIIEVDPFEQIMDVAIKEKNKKKLIEEKE